MREFKLQNVAWFTELYGMDYVEELEEIVECPECGEEYGLHIDGVTIFQGKGEDAKVTTTSKEVPIRERNIFKIMCQKMNIRGSVVITRFSCEHCSGRSYYRIERFYKGAVYVMYVACLTHEMSETLWRD